MVNAFLTFRCSAYDGFVGREPQSQMWGSVSNCVFLGPLSSVLDCGVHGKNHVTRLKL